MINKYGTKIELKKLSNYVYKLICSSINIMEVRIGNSETINSESFVSFKGGPFIRQGMNLKDINEKFPNIKINKILFNESIYITNYD